MQAHTKLKVLTYQKSTITQHLGVRALGVLQKYVGQSKEKLHKKEKKKVKLLLCLLVLPTVVNKYVQKISNFFNIYFPFQFSYFPNFPACFKIS